MAKKKRSKTKEESSPTMHTPESILGSVEALYDAGSAAWVDAEESFFEGVGTTGTDYSASTYGEVTPQGVAAIIKKFHSRFSDSSGAFYDLGSGLGRMVSQVSLLTNIGKSCGVEICPNRHAAAQKLADTINFPASTPTFLRGNFLEQDYSDATIVYFDNTTYELHTFKKVCSLLPKDCVVVYQSQWLAAGDPFFGVSTTYNSKKPSEDKDRLFFLIYQNAGWRYAGGHEF